MVNEEVGCVFGETYVVNMRKRRIYVVSDRSNLSEVMLTVRDLRRKYGVLYTAVFVSERDIVKYVKECEENSL